MESHTFDALLRSFVKSRRSFVAAASATVAGLLVRQGVDSKKKRKHKHKKGKPKAKPNEYGCLEVGDPCTTVNQCCSGICEGKKCRAHDTGTCDQQADGACEAANPATALCTSECACMRTTAGSKICGIIANPPVEFCADCQRDADCAALGYPIGSACVPLGGEGICKGACKGGMACVVPCGYRPPAP